jgi:hypothetical protein
MSNTVILLFLSPRTPAKGLEQSARIEIVSAVSSLPSAAAATRHRLKQLHGGCRGGNGRGRAVVVRAGPGPDGDRAGPVLVYL